MLTSEASIVIIGGGVVGCSIAYHLAKRGVTDVVLVERELLGSGSTSKAAGGVRHQFSTEISIRFSIESIRSFENFQAELGADPLLNQHGYLFLATNPGELQALREAVALQQGLGVATRLLTPDEILCLVPQLNVRDVLGGTHYARDGRAGPHEVTQAFASQARKLGAKLYEYTEATGIVVRNGRVQGVETGRGPIRTERVIDAAGAYAGIVGRMAGLDVPVKPRRRHLFFTAPFDALPVEFPLTAEIATGFHFRREGPGIMLAMNDPEEPNSFRTTVNWEFLPGLVERGLYWLPVLEQAQIMTAWAGLYEETPDYHPLIGESQQVKGFIVAAGFNGHGFMHSPATGKLIAELIVDGQATTIDISPLRPDRFAEGRPIAGVHLL
ncbi:MAG: FAD-binding oxidoreductase [Chloroflexi bacterium]|nr:FAD-binding oxidoreductase [Chloroflexota bacterium]MCL5026001.1 FAD-binding oxidoreductase [Chloroflexota bacterium]